MNGPKWIAMDGIDRIGLKLTERERIDGMDLSGPNWI